jgi:hypothetical protein
MERFSVCTMARLLRHKWKPRTRESGGQKVDRSRGDKWRGAERVESRRCDHPPIQVGLNRRM